eukprot:scpid93421/ scgid29592/ 
MSKPESTSTDVHPMSHVKTEYDGNCVTFTADDGSVSWDPDRGYWGLTWKWIQGAEPVQPIGSGIGEYSRSKLTPEQEAEFCSEVDSWIDQGWLEPHDPDKHGKPEAVLLLLAVAQEHKPTTPVRPCLDYCRLNAVIVSSPGADTPVCQEKIREWRASSPEQSYEMLDIRKAYLQVHIAPELQRFQTVLWKGRTYVITRMGFGLSIAPKFMHVIVQWATRRLPEEPTTTLTISRSHVPKCPK